MRWQQYVEQAQVTNWPLRIALVGIVVAVIGLVIWAMWRGWQNRLHRQGDIPAPAAVGEGPWQGRSAGLFLGSSRHGDWLDRIIVADLGIPSRADVMWGPQGVWCERVGARSVFIPRADIVSVRRDRGVAGMVREKDGVLVLTWRLGQTLIDTGFRADDPDAHHALLDGVVGLVERT
jgi:hypothetical protein